MDLPSETVQLSENKTSIPFEREYTNMEKIEESERYEENALNDNDSEKIMEHLSELSSGSDSSEPLLMLLKNKRSSRRRSQERNSDSTVNETNSDESDAGDSTVSTSQKSNKMSINSHTKDIYSAKVELMKLPSNMESILKKYNLVEIRDAHQNIIASKERTRRNEVQNNSPL